jgi:putative Mg2+ transporter-C (MgtC) family protein
MDLSITWIDLEMIARLIIAVGLGAIIGYEREITHKPAGLRTHIFVCMGACLFTISSLYLINNGTLGTFDSTRIAAGIVTGISFIGAGSIIASKGDIKGITTAASLWVVAAIGLMIGFGIYLLPIIATIITFIILQLGRVKKRKIL